jgi:hypothetical protein
MGAPGETLIYIRIKGKQPECWAPADGVRTSGNIYRVVSILGDEDLEFRVGDLVRCEDRCFPDGSEVTMAVAAAGPTS